MEDDRLAIRRPCGCQRVEVGGVRRVDLEVVRELRNRSIGDSVHDADLEGRHASGDLVRLICRQTGCGCHLETTRARASRSHRWSAAPGPSRRAFMM